MLAAFSFLKLITVSAGAGEPAQRLRSLAALGEVWVQLPAPTAAYNCTELWFWGP